MRGGTGKAVEGKRRSLVFPIVLLAIVVPPLAFAGWYLMQPARRIAELTRGDVIAKATSGKDLPYRLDSITVLTDVYFEGTTVVHEHDVTWPAGEEEPDWAGVRTRKLEQLCDELRKVLTPGVVDELAVRYNVEGTTTTIAVKEADC